MKFYTLAKFKQDGYTIPNLPDDFVIENDRAHDILWVKVKSSLLYTEQELEHLGSDPNIMRELFSLYTSYDDPKWRDTNNERGYRLGLIDRKNYEAGRSLLDGLYYKYNPINYYHANGNLKRGFWTALRERINGRGKYSQATTHMLQHAMNILAQEFPDQDDDALRMRLYEKSYVHPSDIFKCHVTNLWYQDAVTTSRKIGNQYTRTFWDLKPEDYGYINVPGHDGWWMKPDQVLHNNRIYDRDQLHLVNCPQCNRESIESEMVDGICRECFDNKYKIHSYSTRVPTLLKFKAKNVKPNVEPLYFGIELEYETTSRDKAKVKVCDLLQGHAILKSDGSIQNGFEIVTCPATADIHLETFKNFYDNMPKELKTASNVGMHIHISRKPLNMFTIGKMTEFLNRDNNKAFITYVAGRQPNNYCRMDEKRTLTFPLYDRGDRYNTLNLGPDQTVEMRIFATPENYDQFAQRLQFADALVHYCGPAQLSVPLKELTQYGTFLKWVHQHHKDYPELSNHLKGI